MCLKRSEGIEIHRSSKDSYQEVGFLQGPIEKKYHLNFHDFHSVEGM